MKKLKVGVLSYNPDNSEVIGLQLDSLGHEAFAPESFDRQAIQKFFQAHRELDVVIVFTHPKSILTTPIVGLEAGKVNASTKLIKLTTNATRKANGKLGFEDARKDGIDAILLMPYSVSELNQLLDIFFPDDSYLAVLH